MTKRQFHVLYRDFLRRIVDLEVLSSHARGDASTLIGQFIALLIFLSLLFSVPAIFMGGKLRIPGQAFLVATWSTEHFLIATTMLVVGLFATLSWNSFFPDKTDLLILAPLPVRPQTLFLAKVAAVGTGLALLLVSLHLLAGLVWPLALNKYLPAQTMPSFATDRALDPVEAHDVEYVMNRDCAEWQRNGVFRRAGVAIGVVKHGERRVFTYGTAKADSIFEIASVTKTFTALLLAQMAGEGGVQLDQPVRSLLPPDTVDKPEGREITLRDLATHHSGLPRMPAGFQPVKKNDPFADYHAADLYGYIARHGVGRPANASFLYSNVGVGLLGQVLADRARTSYGELVKTEIAGPLGLHDTAAVLSPEQRRRLLQGYNGLTDGPDGFRRSTEGYGDPVPAWNFDAFAGAGALHSTAPDMLTYLEANLHPLTKGGQLAAALLQTQKPMADASVGSKTRIGLVWLRMPEGYYWHDGGSLGFSSVVFFDPKDDYAAVVLSNGLLSAHLIALHLHQRLRGLPALHLGSEEIPVHRASLLAALRLFVAYWLTMLTAGVFIYCSVLALQGLASQMLPRQWFLRCSSPLQMISFCLIVCVYFLQPLLAAPNPLDLGNAGLPDWSPSYWFLGLFQRLNGSTALGFLAKRAVIGLAVAIGTTVITYTWSYLRSLRRIVEEPDISPGRRRQGWLPRFGTAPQTALMHFTIRTLLRSRQHRLILAFYLGVALAASVFLLRNPTVEEFSDSTAALLAATIIVVGFFVVGMRAVFSLPLDLQANWIFRAVSSAGRREAMLAMRHSLWLLAVAPASLIAACLLMTAMPVRSSVAHLVLLLLLGMVLVEWSLGSPQKIPFTCSWLPGKSNFHITFWVAILLVVRIILWLAMGEEEVLKSPLGYAATLLLLLAAVLSARWRRRRSFADEAEALTFEETPSWQLTTLSLNR